MINHTVDDTRERILEAAAEEFARRGFEGGRVARIAVAARVNKQLLFHYFGSKAGLYRAALARAIGQLETAWKSGSGPAASDGRKSAGDSVLERLRQDVDRIFALPHQQGRYARLVLLDLLGAGGPQQETQKLLAALLGGFKRALSEGQGLGFFRDDVDPDLVASQLLVALLGYLALEPAGQLRGTVGRESWARETADLWWRALTW